MIEVDRVLIADGSQVLRSLLSKILAPYASGIERAASSEEAREILGSGTDFSLVLADVNLPGEGGLALLEFLHGASETRPSFILTGTHIDVEAETRASLLGAIAALHKPLTLRRIATALRSAEGPFVPTSPRAYWAPVCAAVLLGDDGKAQELEIPIHDLSRTGAFLGSPAPLAVGTTLEMRLELGGHVHSLRARVVRVQEPDWGHPAGIGVTFVDVAESTQQLLDVYVSERIADVGRPERV